MALNQRVWAIVPATLFAYACASSDAESTAAGSRAFPGDPSAGSPAAAGAAPTEAGLERELESLYEAPIATGRFVWVANPKSGRVALVDSKNLSVSTIEAGFKPTHLAALPPGCTEPCDDDRVIVLNVGSKDATLVKVGAALETVTLPVASGGNHWTISPNGRFAVAWTDARKEPKADRTQGFQDIAVLDLEARTSVVLSVGYRPVAVGFATTNDSVFAVTQDGISVVDLTGPAKLTKNVAISDDPLEDPGTRDVSLTPDGAYAMVRRDGSPGITLISMATAARKTVTLDGPVTDLDLSPNGDRAIAVVRSTSTAFVLPVPEIWNDTTVTTKLTLTGETIGSVAFAPTGSRALLYTNETAVERVAVLELTPLSSRTVRLYSPVLAAFLSPDAAHGIVLHPPKNPDTGAIAKGAFSLVSLALDLPAKIVSMDASPMNVAFSPQGDRGIVTERNDSAKVYGAYVATLPSFAVTRYPLASPPIAAGVASRARRAFVAQEHPEGRITFFDFDSGQARTLTGFELAARVVDGSLGR